MHIVSISGPEVVRSGSELKLDCDYDYMAEEESQLDLKWYFNGSPVPVGVTIDIIVGMLKLTISLRCTSGCPA